MTEDEEYGVNKSDELKQSGMQGEKCLYYIKFLKS